MKLTTSLLSCLTFCLMAVTVTAAEPTQEEVQAYINQMAESHQRLYKAGERFGKSLGPFLQGQEADTHDVHRAFQLVAQTLGKVMKESKDWEVPNHPAARKASLANDQFMEYQVRATLEWLPDMIDIIEDETSSVEERSQQLLAELEEGGKEEAAIGEKVRTAVQNLADAFEIELE